MDNVLLVAFPYIALTLAVLGGIYRYFTSRFTYSSMSSEILEKPLLFWGSVPWHYGIIAILLAHLFAGLFPFAAARFLPDTTRLLVLELAGLSLGLFTLLGLVTLFIRRIPRGSRARASASAMDWVLLIVLAGQVFSGVGIALFERWGSVWYLYTAVPWFWSIFRLAPDASTVVPLSALAKFHAVNGFLVILLFPFTRLVHIFTVPITYLWRPYQVVVWNRGPRAPADRMETRP